MAKHSMRCSIINLDRFKANLRDVFLFAAVEGIDLTSHRKESASKLVCLAVELGAAQARGATVKAPVALPSPVGPTDSERLRAAMAAAGLTNATLGAAIGVSRDVVKNAVRGLAMGPALRAWLAGQEAEVSK